MERHQTKQIKKLIRREKINTFFLVIVVTWPWPLFILIALIGIIKALFE